MTTGPNILTVPTASHISVFLFLFLTGAVAVAQVAQADVAAIVDRMQQAAQENRTHYRPYIVTREYRMFGSDEQQPKSEVTAEVSFVPPTRKDFRITDSSGSSRGESVVRHILEDESKAAASGTAPGALTRENYDFQLQGQEVVNGRPCFVLLLRPKREDKSLLRGKAWIDTSTYLVHRVDGDMAKMPSWWLKSVHVTLDFDEVDGMWLQDRTRAVADVRMVGRHVLTSEAVRIQTGNIEAQNLGTQKLGTQRVKAAPKAHRPFGSTDTILGAGVIQRYHAH